MFKPAQLERDADAERAVEAAAVAVRVAMRADAERGLACEHVARDERPDRVERDDEAELLELGS